MSTKGAIRSLEDFLGRAEENELQRETEQKIVEEEFPIMQSTVNVRNYLLLL